MVLCIANVASHALIDIASSKPASYIVVMTVKANTVAVTQSNMPNQYRKMFIEHFHES